MKTIKVKLNNGIEEERLVIYTITSLCSPGGPTLPRCCGYYTSLEKAKECVENDWGGFSEAGYYDYIVIEKVVEGLYNAWNAPDPVLDKQHQWWYTYDGSRWITTDSPECYKNLVDFWGS